MTLDLTRLAQKPGQGSNLSPGLRQSLTYLHSVDLAPLAGDVWLDPQGRVRRLGYTLKIQIQQTTLSEVETMTFSDFGVPVNVTAPATTDTVPFSTVKDQLAPLTPGATVSA